MRRFSLKRFGPGARRFFDDSDGALDGLSTFDIGPWASPEPDELGKRINEDLRGRYWWSGAENALAANFLGRYRHNVLVSSGCLDGGCNPEPALAGDGR